MSGGGAQHNCSCLGGIHEHPGPERALSERALSAHHLQCPSEGPRYAELRLEATCELEQVQSTSYLCLIAPCACRMVLTL